MIHGIYIHIPFCTKRCHYCDFYSLKTTLFQNKNDQFELFINALIKEITYFSDLYKENIYSTIYLGGGTPSLLPTPLMITLFNQLYKSFRFKNNIEISIETNPESLDENKLQCYKDLGINRISLGCQTFNNDILKVLGRETTNEEIIKKYSLIRKKGFDNVNLDLMFGLINQSFDDYKKDLQQIIQLQPDHISSYSLIQGRKILDAKINQESNFLPGDDCVADEFIYTYDFLEKNAYQFYEISNYSHQGKECKHNLIYWSLEDYLGLGPSACGTINNTRYTNVYNLKQYIDLLSQNKSPVHTSETLHQETRNKENIMLSLRTKRGLDIHQLEKNTTVNWFKRFQNNLDQLINEGFLIKNGKNISATPKGVVLLDNIIVQLL